MYIYIYVFLIIFFLRMLLFSQQSYHVINVSGAHPTKLWQVWVVLYLSVGELTGGLVAVGLYCILQDFQVEMIVSTINQTTRQFIEGVCFTTNKDDWLIKRHNKCSPWHVEMLLFQQNLAKKPFLSPTFDHPLVHTYLPGVSSDHTGAHLHPRPLCCLWYSPQENICASEFGSWLKDSAVWEASTMSYLR